jgi:hypothetical protein
MNALKLTFAAALLASSCGFAAAQGEPTKGSDPTASTTIKQQPGESKSAPAQGAQAPAPKGSMKSTNTGMPGGATATTPGTVPNAGTGKGTTGTGQQGGSGNR